MAAGAGQWEAASSKVNFIYVPAQDGSCTTRNSSVLFSVEPTKTTQYIARAFFPSTSKRSRNVLVNAKSLYNSGSWTPSNILAHELGHTLGFRHEHTRPEAGTCFEDNNWRPLTPYDSGVDHALPPVQRDLEQPQHDRPGPCRRARPVRQLTRANSRDRPGAPHSKRDGSPDPTPHDLGRPARRSR